MLSLPRSMHLIQLFLVSNINECIEFAHDTATPILRLSARFAAIAAAS